MAFTKTSIVAALVAIPLAAGLAATVGEPWAVGEPQDGRLPDGRLQDPTEFLQRMTGEWSVVAEAVLGPGQEPIRTESREVARLLGGKWLVAEGSGTAPDGRPFTTILTVGYDPAEERYVGTWISSLQTRLWSYTGTLDDAGTALTLETEGPIMGDPTTTTRYREIIEIPDADHKVMRSLIVGPDGEWFEYARAEYRRVE